MSESEELMEKREVPGGLKIISVLFLLIGVAMFVQGFMTLDRLAASPPGVVVGTSALLGAAVSLLLAYTLWRGLKWARVVAILFALLFIAGGITSLGANTIAGITNIVIGAAVSWYLLKNEAVRVFFSPKP